MLVSGNSSACNCALAAQLAANELEQLGIRLFAAGNFKMGGFRHCFHIVASFENKRSMKKTARNCFFPGSLTS